MANDSTQPQNPYIRPMNEPHIPVTETEMNPNLHNESPASGRNTLLILVSLLILIGAVGILLFLYVQNKNTSKNNPNALNPKNIVKSVTPTNTPKSLKLDPEVNALCGNPREYTSFTDALEEKNYNEICILNLKAPDSSYQFPSDITKKKLFSKLAILKLSGYDLSNFPQDLSKLPNLLHLSLTDSKIAYVLIEPNTLSKLKTLDLSNNKITKLPDTISSLKSLEKLILTGNVIPDKEKERIKKLLTGIEIVF